LNKIILIKKTSSIFLAAVLVLGTIAAFSPSFMTASAHAQQYYGMDNKYNSYYEPKPYQPEYGMDIYKKSYGNDNYEQPEYSSYQPDYNPEYPSYGKDNNSYKSKDISVNINKLNCIINNVNINGNNTGITTLVIAIVQELMNDT